VVAGSPGRQSGEGRDSPGRRTGDGQTRRVGGGVKKGPQVGGLVGSGLARWMHPWRVSPGRWMCEGPKSGVVGRSGLGMFCISVLIKNIQQVCEKSRRAWSGPYGPGVVVRHGGWCGAANGLLRIPTLGPEEEEGGGGIAG
jgi:hypothetical protein